MKRLQSSDVWARAAVVPVRERASMSVSPWEVDRDENGRTFPSTGSPQRSTAARDICTTSSQEEDETISEYIPRLRLERCCGELNRMGMRYSSIADLAYSWGFRSLSYFGKAFRRRYGITPGRQRAQIAESGGS